MGKVVEMKTNEEAQTNTEAQTMARKYNITKIKASKAEPHFLTINYSGSDKKGSKETVFTGYEEMLDNDYYLIQSLVSKVIDVLEFPQEWIEELTITGITLNYDYENDGALRGMVVTMQRDIENLNCPLNINTPFIKFKSYVDDYISFPPSENTWDDSVSEIIYNVIRNTFKYMCGNSKTKQQSLFA